MVELIVLLCLFGVGYAVYRLYGASREVSTIFEIVFRERDRRESVRTEGSIDAGQAQSTD